MSAWPWLLGAGAAGAYAWSREKQRATRPQLRASEEAKDVPVPMSAGQGGPARPLPTNWAWPVPAWNGRAPVISDGVGTARPGGLIHRGVDIMFRRERFDIFPVGSPNGSRGFVMPDEMTAVAVADGILSSAMQTSRGFAVVIEHRPYGLTTFYQHLSALLVEPTGPNGKHPAIRVGQPVGIIGGDPLDASKLKHLHFEVWAGGPNKALDPAMAMRSWTVLRDPRATLIARNAGFTFRPVGASGDAYPDWVRDLKFKSGVYLIRDANTHELLYVGSSSGRLYDTLTRHFQTWRRYKGYWAGQYAEGHDPGLTYPRDSVEVAIRITRSDNSLDEEARLIHRLRPRDNLLGQPSQELEEAPF